MTSSNQLSPKTKADIQGFITSGYGHLPFGAYLFVELRDRAQAQTWLSAVLPRVTTAASWRQVPDEPKFKPERALNIAFTYAGLDALGVGDVGLHSFPSEFRDGMASPERSRILGDTGESAPSNWELGGPLNKAIHALLILHASTQQDLDSWCREERELLHGLRGVKEHADIAQYGARSANGREHFGFFDGASQPGIEGIKGEGIRTGEFILGYRNEYDFFPVSPVVPSIEDPEHILPRSRNPYYRRDEYRDFGLNGTYLAYRKMAQDVASLWRFLWDESIRVEGTPNPRFMVWLAAKMVGRWPGGAPLVLSPDSDRVELRTADFSYAETDPNGLACPVGSHIRRTNPRDQFGRAGPVQSMHMSRRHRIIRRGIPYGKPLFDPEVETWVDKTAALWELLNSPQAAQPRGVHFLCANANLKSQFELIQQGWVNNPTFGGLTGNRDPLVGDNDPTAWPGVMLVPGPNATLRTSALPRFVTLRGGGYFFMPSLTALRYLAQSHQLQ